MVPAVSNPHRYFGRMDGFQSMRLGINHHPIRGDAVLASRNLLRDPLPPGIQRRVVIGECIAAGFSRSVQCPSRPAITAVKHRVEHLRRVRIRRVRVATGARAKFAKNARRDAIGGMVSLNCCNLARRGGRSRRNIELHAGPVPSDFAPASIARLAGRAAPSRYAASKMASTVVARWRNCTRL